MSSDASHILLPGTGVILLAVFLPLLSFFVSLIVAEKHSWLIYLFAPALLLGATICAIISGITWWNYPGQIYIEWFTISGLTFGAGLSVTTTSLLMMSLVSLISFLVHLYSVGYMAGDGGIKRYFAGLGFFTFSMQGIVLANDLLLLFVFWELVGISSYMLIGHWMAKPQAGRAALKAFIMNRVGDAGFLIGLMIIWAHTSTLNLDEILRIPATHNWQLAASLCILCGVAGKSAQFPLFTWLPDAMEGPTPVSALIHAATMVAAGVYLLIRIFPLFPPQALDVIAVIGLLTALLGALAALSQYDIKKILAYSTISQLGLMLIAIGAGSPKAALLHLFTHAFFKACLFLCAGSVIFSLHQALHGTSNAFDVQDIRNLGGLRKKLPFTFAAFVISGASLAGIPFFSGFLSKEAILTSVWVHHSSLRGMLLIGTSLVSFITVLYIFRLVWTVFMKKETKTLELPVNESPAIMQFPMTLLALGSLWFTVSFHPFHAPRWLPITPGLPHVDFLAFFSVLWVIIALLVSWWLFRSRQVSAIPLLQHAFYIDVFYQNVIARPVLKISELALQIDKRVIDPALHAVAYAQVTWAHIIGWIDTTFVDGIVNFVARFTAMLGRLIRSFQGGKVQRYIFWAILALIVLMIWILNE